MVDLKLSVVTVLHRLLWWAGGVVGRLGDRRDTACFAFGKRERELRAAREEVT